MISLIKSLPFLNRIDHHLREVLKKASLVLILRFLQTGLGFVLNILVAKLFGAEGVGAYYLALTVTGIGTAAGCFGLENTFVRFIAANAGQKRWEQIAGVYRQGTLLALVTSTLTFITIFANAAWIAEKIFSDASLVGILQIMSISIVPASLLSLNNSALMGLKRPSVGMIPLLSHTLLNIILLFPLRSLLGIEGLAVAYVVSNIIALAVGLYFWHHYLPQINRLWGIFDFRLLLRTSFPLMLIALVKVFSNWTGTFVLGVFASTEDVGVYGVALRVALLTTFVLTAVNSIVAPKFAELYEERDTKTLGKLARDTASVLALVAFPFLVLFVFFPGWILNFFGDDFVRGGTALTILAIGNFINVATGSVGRLLIMTGYEKLVQYNVFGAVLLNILLSLILIPRLGITGAALATATTFVIQNLISVWLVYWKLSILTIPIPGKRFLFKKSS